MGSNPRQTSEAIIVIIQGQTRSLVQLPDVGNLQVTALNSASACVIDDRGKYRAVDLEAGTVTSSWAADCSLSAASDQARSNPAVTVPAARRVVGRLLADTSPQVPSVTPSYYEYASYYSECGSTPNPDCPLYEQGASALSPTSDGLLVLDFGSPCYDPSNASVYGVEMFFVPTCIPDTSLVPLVQNWISGYESQNRSGTPNLTLAIGTSNSLNGVDTGAGGALTNSQLQAAGVDWYTRLVAAVPTAGLHAPVSLWGASDMEQSGGGDWYGGAATEAWVNGFASASPADGACVQTQSGYLADYGDDVLGGSGSADGWTVQQVYAVAWGIQVSCALPEIYYFDMASEWEALSQWGTANGGTAIAFSGVITEIESGSLEPDDAWYALQSDSEQSPPIPSVTTISWTLQNLPQISSVTPNQGPLLGGTQVDISGSNLSGTQAVYFGDNPATSFTVLGATALTATTPAASGGSVSVTVATAVGTSSPAISAFSYSNGPCTSAGLSASPASVTAGTPISLTASAACATGSVAAFVYWVKAPGSTTWVNQTPWTGPTWTFSTSGLPSGAYGLMVWASTVPGSVPDAEATTSVVVSAPGTCAVATLSASTTSVAAGTPVGMTARATCAEGMTPTFVYWIEQPGSTSWVNQTPWTGAAWTFETSGLASGTYGIMIWASASPPGGSPQAEATTQVTVRPPGSCTSATLSASPSSVTEGTSINLAAAATCPASVTPVFVYWVQAPGSSTWVNETPWTGPAWTFDTSGRAPGTYGIMIWANSVGGSVPNTEATTSVGVSAPGTCSGAGLSANPTTVTVGTPVSLTAAATCADGLTPTFVYWVEAPGSGWVNETPWTGPDWTFVTSGLSPGTYGIMIWASASPPGGSPQAEAIIQVTLVAPGDCTTATLSANPASVTVGTAVALTATAACPSGVVPAFVYWVRVPGSSSWVNETPWTGPSWRFVTSGLASGTYGIMIWANAVPGGVPNAEANTSVVVSAPGTCGGVSLTADPSTAQQGTPVSLTATASCATGVTATFVYWVQAPGSTNSVNQTPWTGPAWTFVTSGLAPGSYGISVWVSSSPPGGSPQAVAETWITVLS